MGKVHTSREYEAELARVRDNLLAMTGRVEAMIGDSVRCLIDGNVPLAKKTIAEDHKVNRLEVETDDQCLLILAKRQPMASDLRFITLAMKMVTDLERIGDLAVNISERCLALQGYQPAVIGPTIGRMGEINQVLIRDAIASFVDKDAEAAQIVIDRDEEVDSLYLSACNDIQTRMGDVPNFLERGMHLQAAAKFLERIGDHITNLAELVIFMVKGKDIRHIGSFEDV